MRFGLALVSALVSSLAAGCKQSSHSSDTDGAVDAASPTGPTIARSGSRLKLTWAQTSDGTRVPWQTDEFFDVARGESCETTLFADGHSYCAPMKLAGQPYYYADSSCTVPVLKAPSILGYFYETPRTTDACAPRPVVHLYKAGAIITTPPTLWTLESDGTCGSPQGPGAGAMIYATQEVLPSEFVEITTTAVGTGPLQQVELQSADGLLWPKGRGYDTALATECGYQEDSPTTAHCTPAQAYAHDFADATCSSAKLEVYANGCSLPASVAILRQCGPFDPTVYALGSPVAATPLYDEACDPTTPTMGATYYSLGAAIGSSTTLARGSTPTAGQRLAPIFVTTTDLTAWDYLLDDPMIGSECGFTYDPNHDVACLPQQKWTIPLFSDVGCQVPVDVVEIQPTGCGAFFPIPRYAWKSISTTQWEIHEVTTQHVPTLYTGVPSSCEQYNPSVGLNYPEYFDVDPTPIPWTTFEQATLVVDP